jgi:hypothetical protein
MSLYPCSACGERPIGQKLAQCTWAWWNAANTRVAWRQRLCVACYATTLAPLSIEAQNERLECPACHTNVELDMDPVYATVFVPGHGPLRLELPLCGPCAVEIRNRAMLGAVKLEDRGFGGQDTGPQTETPASAWDAFIGPRS